MSNWRTPGATVLAVLLCRITELPGIDSRAGVRVSQRRNESTSRRRTPLAADSRPPLAGRGSLAAPRRGLGSRPPEAGRLPPDSGARPLCVVPLLLLFSPCDGPSPVPIPSYPEGRGGCRAPVLVCCPLAVQLSAARCKDVHDDYGSRPGRPL
jgi:hypothetical protein